MTLTLCCHSNRSSRLLQTLVSVSFLVGGVLELIRWTINLSQRPIPSLIQPSLLLYSFLESILKMLLIFIFKFVRLWEFVYEALSLLSMDGREREREQ